MPNFDIGVAIKNSKDSNLIINGGGHKMAAGFTLTKENLNKFISHIEKQYFKLNPYKKNNLFFYESKISSSAFNRSFYNEISKLFPFGTGNTEPYFLFENLKTELKKIYPSMVVVRDIDGRISSMEMQKANAILGFRFVSDVSNPLVLKLLDDENIDMIEDSEQAHPLCQRDS